MFIVEPSSLVIYFCLFSGAHKYSGYASRSCRYSMNSPLKLLFGNGHKMQKCDRVQSSKSRFAIETKTLYSKRIMNLTFHMVIYVLQCTPVKIKSQAEINVNSPLSFPFKKGQ